MTYTYSHRVTSVKLFGLLRLLKIWKASVYKLVVKEMLIFCVLYAAASLIYRFGLKTTTQKKRFEKVVVYCGTFDSILPVTFVLGFYVSVVVQRWWSQFMHIPWPDRFMSYISTLIPGVDEATTIIRRTIVRYLLLCEVLLLMTVSAPIKKRFPTVESLVDEGLMTQKEIELYSADEVPKLSTKFWIPAEWCAMLLGRARREKKIKDNFTLTVLLNELSNYKTCLYTIFFYDWISLPLVYTQVTTIAVYGMYFNSVMSRQYINDTSVREDFGPEVSAKYSIDLYVPIDTFLQLFFYLGWLKVAEQMMNPLGEDDDDFQCNFIIDRNLKVGLFAVDRLQHMEPPLVKDSWWENDDPTLSYTQSTRKFSKKEWLGSTANLTVPPEQHIAVLPDIPESPSPPGDDVDGGSNAGSSTLSVGRKPGSPASKDAARRRSTRPCNDAAIGSAGSIGLSSSRRDSKVDCHPSQPSSPGPLGSAELPPAPFHFPTISHQQQLQHQQSSPPPHPPAEGSTGRLPQTMEICETAGRSGSLRRGGGSGGVGGGGGGADKDSSAPLMASHVA